VQRSRNAAEADQADDREAVGLDESLRFARPGQFVLTITALSESLRVGPRRHFRRSDSGQPSSREIDLFEGCCLPSLCIAPGGALSILALFDHIGGGYDVQS